MVLTLTQQVNSNMDIFQMATVWFIIYIYQLKVHKCTKGIAATYLI